MENIQSIDGIDHVTFQLIRFPSSIVGNPFVRTTYPSEWVSFYFLNNIAEICPILDRASSKAESFPWSEVTFDKGAEFIFETLTSFGLGTSGFTVPMLDGSGERSLLSLNSRMESDKWSAFIGECKSDMIAAAKFLHDIGVTEALGDGGDLPRLGPRERECLMWASLGKTGYETSRILSLSEHTVNSYLKTARKKLNCVSIAQAVAKSICSGQIPHVR